MNIGIRMNGAIRQYMNAGAPKNSIAKQLTGIISAGKGQDGSAQALSPSMRMRMAMMNEAQNTLPQGKREIVFDAASGTTFDAQRMSRSAASLQKKMKKLQYNFKLISSQIMRAKTSGSAARAVSSARRMTAQLRRKRNSGEYDEAELEAAITHARAMERVARKHVKNLQQEELAQRGAKSAMSEMPEEETGSADAASKEATSQMTEEEALQEQPVELAEEFEKIQQELSESLSEIPQELAEEMTELMQEIGNMMSETIEELGGELMESLSVVDTDMSSEDIKALKQKHRAKELQEIAKADAKYLKAIFEKYAAEHSQASSGAGATMSSLSGTGGVSGVSLQAVVGGAPTAPATTAPAEGSHVDVSV